MMTERAMGEPPTVRLRTAAVARGTPLRLPHAAAPPRASPERRVSRLERRDHVLEATVEDAPREANARGRGARPRGVRVRQA